MRGKFLVTALSIGAIACAQQGKLAIQPLPTTLAQGDRPVSFRVAEAAGQFAVGNVALALESYRRALREDPQSINALVGRAACYDVFGRFDLSRRDYEAALALAPTDTRLLGLFAASLLRQGHGQEAAAVQREILSRNIPAVTAAIVTVTLPVARQVSAETIALAPVAVTIPASTPTPMPAAALTRAPAPTLAPRTANMSPRAAIRLERLSLGEVALLTSAPAQLARSPKFDAVDHPSSLIRFAAVQPSSLRPFAMGSPALRPMLILNAARNEGIAGRTRHYLAGRGLGGALIGDAPRVLARTMIIAPPSERARALRLAKLFSITPRMRPGTRLTLVLGRNAVRPSLLRG